MLDETKVIKCSKGHIAGVRQQYGSYSIHWSWNKEKQQYEEDDHEAWDSPELYSECPECGEDMFIGY